MCLAQALKKKQDKEKKQKSKSAPSKGLSAEELFLKSLPALPKAPGEPRPPVALPQPVGAPTGGAVLQKTKTQKASRQKAAAGLDALMINLAGDVRT
jgi:hypothetical protein